MRAPLRAAALLVLLAAPTGSALAQPPADPPAGRGGGQGRGAGPAAPPTPQAAAPIDLTGNWVAVISEDWRWRMVTPAKGDYASIPLTQAGKDLADQWDPAKDQAAGDLCKSYGPPGVMRAPTRLQIAWNDAQTLKVDTDYGTQTRLFHFAPGKPTAAPPSRQGSSIATWEMPAGRGRGGAPPTGSLKVVTTNMLPGYLRKNGVPYSANTVFTEYWDRFSGPGGNEWLVITAVVHDPQNLQTDWITSLNFKREPNAAKWDPTACSTTW